MSTLAYTLQSFAGGLMIAVSVIELLRPALSIVGV
jgi:hypothetical protein